MKFKVKEDRFLHDGRVFTKGNEHDSDDMENVTEEHVRAWHKAGFVDLDGEESVERDPTRVVTLAPQNVKHNNHGKGE